VLLGGAAAECAAFVTVTIVTLAFLYISVSAGSSRQIDSLYEFNEGLADVDPAELELDSDEYEFEEDSEAEVPEGSTAGRPLRRAFNLVASHRRQGSRDSSHVVRKRSSLVRITSKDPRSRLCVSPIQLELDERGRRAKAEMGSMHRDVDGTPTRKRRESGRLTSPVLSAPSAEDGGAAASLDAAAGAESSPGSEPAVEDGESASLSSLSSGYSTSSGSFVSLQDAASTFEEVAFRSAAMRLVRRPAPEGPPSILKRLPEVFAGVPQSATATPPGLYPSSQGSFNATSVPWHQQGSIRSMDSAAWPFDGSSSSSYVDSPALGGASSTTSSLPPGAAHSQDSPLAQPAVPRLGSMTPAQVRAAWPGSRRRKSIKLTEPDWTLHAEAHDRARERLETAAQVAAHPDPESLKYVPPRRFETDERWDSGAAGTDDDRAEGEFWFERFCQSTAAAGRDWDWRKRRARRAAERARMLGANASTTSLPAMVGGGTPGEEKPALANGVGRTDVQLQQDRQAHARRMRNHQEQLAGPLISFTSEELRRPNLTVDVSKRIDPLADAAPASPLGRALKSLRTSSYSGASPSQSEKPAYGSALLQHNGSAPMSPPTYTPALIRADNDLSGSARIRQSMGKALRKSSVSSNASTYESSHNRQRRHSEADIRQSDAADGLDVPGRGSSLSAAKQRNKYSSLGRNAGAQLKAERERIDSNASWLLAEAALVAADSGSDGDSPITPPPPAQPQHPLEKQRAGVLRGAFGVQASPTALELHPWDGHVATLPASQQAWSSADAYGSLGSAPSTPSLSLPEKVTQGAGFSPAPPSAGTRRNGSSKRTSTISNDGSALLAPRTASLGVQAANGIDKRNSLRRLDSPADSSTGSSNSGPTASPASKRLSGTAASVADPPHIEIRPPVGSRKAILSASSTASGDMDLVARTRGARRPSLRKAAAEAASPRPAPIMQPEPAPFAMAQRARSASISSKSSKSSGSSYPRSEMVSPPTALPGTRSGPPRPPRMGPTKVKGRAVPAEDITPLSYTSDYAAQWRRRSADASISSPPAEPLPSLPRSMLSA
jgi:hypothetical protein